MTPAHTNGIRPVHDYLPEQAKGCQECLDRKVIRTDRGGSTAWRSTCLCASPSCRTIGGYRSRLGPQSH